MVKYLTFPDCEESYSPRTPNFIYSIGLMTGDMMLNFWIPMNHLKGDFFKV